MSVLDGAVRPKVELTGQDGNALSIIGRCRRAARKAGWTQEQIAAFSDEVRSGDYDNVLMTAMKYFDEPEDDDEMEYD